MRQSELVRRLVLNDISNCPSGRVFLVSLVCADLVRPERLAIRRPWRLCRFLGGGIAQGVQARFECNPPSNIEFGPDAVFILETLHNQGHRLRHEVLQRELQRVLVAHPLRTNDRASRP